MSTQEGPIGQRRAAIRARIEAAAQGRTVRLLAVSKGQPVEALSAAIAAGQTAFGENYVQEALAKQEAIDLPGIEWHLIGPLQSNKAALAARHFDWVQSLDRAKLVPLLAAGRGSGQPPLNVLIQVDIDDEASKSGCRPDEVAALAASVAAHAQLRLRGLMAIPFPHEDPARRRPAFARLRALFETLGRDHPGIDTLSMGMSDDFEIAIAEGATLVRVGTALFGPRPLRR
jgi:PLP dependent protein